MMNPERLSRLKEIVLTVDSLPPEERAAYLVAVCGSDVELRREAEALVNRPERIGPYRIVGLLGEGGMGSVYRAEQSEPIRREVALKLLRGGLDSASALARFDSERHMHARMDHPNVATILDAGTAQDGQPHFVMELVRGVEITDYCRVGRLAVRERVELYLDVCRAVRHAHRRGVVHRDLKPSNILVPVVGGRPVVKVIDFSIAKALDAPGLETAFRTRTGQIVGTLAYMSPEQARGDVGSIDTRSDVYALGVILYALVADRLPVDVWDEALHEAVRRIVEEPPARLRKTTAGSTAGPVDADLETIAAKCLEKDPERRYGSALELTEEIERYLESRPIAAHPPSRAYLRRKLVARHRVAFGVTALVFVPLSVFAVTVSVQLSIQRRQTARAEAEARKAKHVVAYMKEVFLDAGPGSVGRNVTIQDALGVIQRSLEHYDQAELHLQEALRIRREYLGEAHRGVGASWMELANLRFCEGEAADAEPLARRAVGILEAQPDPDHATLAEALNTLGLIVRDQGRLEQAADIFRRALAYGRRIPEPTDLEKLNLATIGESLAGALRRLGQYHEAEALMREAVEVRSAYAEGKVTSGVATSTYNLAMVLHLDSRSAEAETLLCVEGSHGEAEALVREAIEIHRTAGDSMRRYVPQDFIVLSRVLAATGRPDEAVDAAEQAVRAALEAPEESRPRTADALAALGEAEEAAGRWEEARDTHRKALAMRIDVLPAAHPDTARSRVGLARALMHLDQMEEVDALRPEKSGSTDRADEELRQAAAIEAKVRSRPLEKTRPDRWAARLHRPDCLRGGAGTAPGFSGLPSLFRGATE